MSKGKPPAEQRVRWSKREKALLYCFQREKPTSMLIAHVFESLKLSDGKTFAQELEERGYDLSTLRFSIRLKAAECCGCSCRRCKHQGGDGQHTTGCVDTYLRGMP